MSEQQPQQQDNTDTIPSTTEIVQKAQEAQTQQNTPPIEPPVTQQSINNTDNNSGIVKRTIEWVSQDNCGACVKQEEFFNNVLKPQSDVPVEITKVDVKSDRGQQIADENKLKYTPFYTECLIPKDPNEKPKCRTGNKYDPNEWKIKLNNSEDNNNTNATS